MVTYPGPPPAAPALQPNSETRYSLCARQLGVRRALASVRCADVALPAASLLPAPLLLTFRRAQSMHQRKASCGPAAASSVDNTALAEVVAQLLQLKRTARAADDMSRDARNLELQERMLAIAESSSLPRDSFIIASRLNLICRLQINMRTQVALHPNRDTFAHNEAARRAWASCAPARDAQQRCVALVQARLNAGTLLTMTPEETTFFADDDIHHTGTIGAEILFTSAVDAMLQWPQSRTADEERSRLHVVYNATRALLLVFGKAGGAESTPVTVILRPVMTSVMHLLLTGALSSNGRGVLLQLRSVCGLSVSEEAALRSLVPLVHEQALKGEQWTKIHFAERDASADADKRGTGCAPARCRSATPRSLNRSSSRRARAARALSTAPKNIRLLTGSATSARTPARRMRRDA